MSDGKKAVMDNSDARELSHKADKKRTAQLGNLKSIIETALYDHSEYNVEHNKYIHFHYYGVTVKYQKKEYPLWINVGVAKNDNTNHIYAITNKKEDTPINYDVGSPVGNYLQNVSSDNSIPENGEKVNSLDGKSSERYNLDDIDDGTRYSLDYEAATMDELRSELRDRGVSASAANDAADELIKKHFKRTLDSHPTRVEFKKALLRLFISHASAENSTVRYKTAKDGRIHASSVEHLLLSESNYEIDIIKESSKSEAAYGETLATASSKELSDTIIPQIPKKSTYLEKNP